MFIPLLRSGSFVVDLAVQMIGTALVFVLIGLLASTHPRLRIDQALRYFSWLIVLSLSVLAASLMSW
jgi:NADH:ubiquinone oxidoreductase subunit H